MDETWIAADTRALLFDCCPDAAGETKIAVTLETPDVNIRIPAMHVVDQSWELCGSIK